jgi:ATP-dependent helicase/nuclease subunit A
MKSGWTDQQRKGIETVGHSLLVSAAAGSGKTAVLAERCAHLVCAEKDGCDVDQLLVVTFTESAAAEMKARIQEALRKRLLQNPSDRLARQVGLAEHAHVSTVHGFCYRLLKQNFTLAGIDPEFQVLDADEASLLRREIAADLFHQRYEEDETGDFHRLIDAYGDGKDESLIQRIVEIHGLLASLLDPRGWIDDSVASLREAADKPLQDSRLGRDLIRRIDAGLSALVRHADEATRSLRSLGREFDPYIQYLGNLTPFFAHWKQVLATNGLDMLVAEIADYRETAPRIPSVRGQPEGKDLAKSLVDSVKNAVKEKPLGDLLSSTSAQWQAGLRRVAPFAGTLLSLVSDFTAQYSQAKAGQRALDFADLERLSLNILRDGDVVPPRPSPLARSLHEQFRQVLVDEYQDINPIQDAILRLLSRESISETGANLFCVGDVKQSIFRFRLAEPARFLERHKRFSETPGKRAGEVIHLRENFRSRAPLLEAINGIFERLMTQDAAEIEYDQSHRLAAGRTFPPSENTQSFPGAPIELHLLPREPGLAEGLEPMPKSEQLDRVDYEAILVARRILQLMGRDGSPPMNVWKINDAGEPALLPIECKDIVILLRAMRHKADRFADVLRAQGIDVHNEAAGGLFDATEVRDILVLLQILDNQRQDIPLAAVLRSPLGGLPDADDSLARIRLAYPDGTEAIPFHEATRRYAVEKNDELAAHLRDFFKSLHQWRDLANKRPVAELLWELYEQTGYLAFCGGLEDGEQRMANLLELHERAGQFGGFLRQGLYRFLRFLESLQEEDGLGRAAAVGKTDKAVRIMSIHRSKGLEFPVVFLPDLGKEINLSDAHGAILVDRRMGLGMDVVEPDRLIRYPSLASVLVSQNLHRQTVAEELRLLYVAMTRAKEHVILVATCPESDRDKWKTQWENRAGPLPADAVQSAQRVIDWLGPVAAMTGGAPTPIFQIHDHSAQEVRAWKNPRHHRPEFTDRQKRLIRLEPLPMDPPMTDAARQLIKRFQTAYPFDPFTRVRATASVTALAKANAENVNTGSSLQRKLDLPRFFQRDAIPKATDIGNATHALLQYFNFAADPSLSEIERQIADLVKRKLLPSEYANLVDRDAVLWLLQSELGNMIRASHAELIREVPFALIHPAEDCPPSDDPADEIMIRGRIDLLVPTPSGLSIVDYKTDRVSGPELDQRVETYGRQMRLYADAIRTVARREIASVYLVFLSPRRFVKM